jgi:hypothetical protein
VGFTRSQSGVITPPNCWPPGCAPGSARANDTTTEHLEVLAAAITQIARAHRKNMLIRADGVPGPLPACWTG